MGILIVGSKGMLGRAFCALLARRGLDFDAADADLLDITQRDAVQAFIQPHHQAVINCAAYANVDGAESDEQTATRVNGEGVGHLAEACAQRGSVLVHYSTDYVFAGDAQAPYPVDAPHAPINAYGRSKAAGEVALRAAGGPHLLLRTSWLYAPWGSNFVRTIHRASRERPQLRVVDDQQGRPTSAEHLAAATLALLDRKVRGTLHVTDGGVCTWFELAREIVRLAGHACEVQPCSSAEYPRPAKRPAYSVLDLGPTEAWLGPMPAWQANLADVMARLEP